MTHASKFAVFDIDGTLIRWQLYHAVADALVKLNFVEAGAYDSIKASRMDWKTRRPGVSFRSYEHELIRVYEEILAGLTTDQLDKAVTAVFNEYKDQVYTYTRQLVDDLRKSGYFMLAISGSHIEVVSLIAKHYGFDDYIGTVYERAGGKFSGKKHAPSRDKASELRKLVKKNKLTFENSVAIGDSLSDAAMLEMVERPIAFNPDKELYERADREGWAIVIERKNMVYELEKKGDKYELAKTNTR
jgi:HAD superfamily hydrolase (TIGR01490 family)